MINGITAQKEIENRKTEKKNPNIALLDTEFRKFLKNTEKENHILFSESQITFTDFLSNKLLIVFAIKKGIPYSIFSLIQNITPFTINDWAEYLDISSKSLIRYRLQDKSFKPIHSEKIIELAEVTNLGVEVFGDNQKFRQWLETPNYALGNLKPFDLLRDSYGKDMIIGELTRIDHGILA